MCTLRGRQPGRLKSCLFCVTSFWTSGYPPLRRFAAIPYLIWVRFWSMVKWIFPTTLQRTRFVPSLLDERTGFSVIHPKVRIPARLYILWWKRPKRTVWILTDISCESWVPCLIWERIPHRRSWTAWSRGAQKCGGISRISEWSISAGHPPRMPGSFFLDGILLSTYFHITSIKKIDN